MRDIANELVPVIADAWYLEESYTDEARFELVAQAIAERLEQVAHQSRVTSYVTNQYVRNGREPTNPGDWEPVYRLRLEAKP